jgi:hypothetical protein
MSVKKTLDSAKQVLFGEIAKYANIVASQRPASTPSKVARRQLAEIYAAIQAIEVGERALKDGLVSERSGEAVGEKTLERLYRGGREWA